MAAPADSQSAAHPLAIEFLKLSLPNGQPDKEARNRALDALLDVLTPWERWCVRAWIKERTTGLALLPDLPGEIIAMIGSYLDFRDIYACRAACRAWRDVWKSDNVARDLLRRFYPGLLETSLTAAGPQPPALALLEKATRKTVRRINGGYVARWTEDTSGDSITNDLQPGAQLSPDPAAHPDGEFPSMHPTDDGQGRRNHFSTGTGKGPLYSHGRIAWQWDRCCYFLDDLNSGHRRLVSWTEGNLRGIITEIVALTSHLIVLTSEQRSLVVVYHIELQEFRRITLPSRLDRCYADRTTIGFALRPASQIYLWRWGESLQLVDLPSAHREIPDQHDQTGFLFHPTDPKAFFIATLTLQPRYPPDKTRSRKRPEFRLPEDEPRCDLRFHVSEYLDRRHVHTTTHARDDLPREIMAFQRQEYPEPGHGIQHQLPVHYFHRLINAHGGHAFLAIEPTVKSFAVAEYNVMTRQFGIVRLDVLGPEFTACWSPRRYRLRTGSTPFVWDRQLYFHATPDEEGYLTVDAYVRKLDVDRGWLADGEPTIDFLLAGIRENGQARIFGDDRFLVMIHDPTSQYTVWDLEDGDGSEARPRGWLTRQRIAEADKASREEGKENSGLSNRQRMEAGLPPLPV